MKKIVKVLLAASILGTLATVPMVSYGAEKSTTVPEQGDKVPLNDLIIKFLAIPEYEPTRYTKSNGGKFAPEEIEKGLLIGAHMKLGEGNPDGMMSPLAHSFNDIVANVDADQKTGKIVITYNGLTLEMEAGSNIATLNNGKSKKTLTIPDGTEPYFYKVDGETTPEGEPYYVCYLPVKFTAEALGATVTWDEQMHRLVMSFAFYYSKGAVEPIINGSSPYTTKKMEGGGASWDTIKAIATPANAQKIGELVKAGVAVVNDAYQNDDGGWGKTNKEYDLLEDSFDELLNHAYSTFDNGSTHGHLKFLSRVLRAYNEYPDAFKGYESQMADIEDGFWRGVAYMEKAQNDLGGWPQYYPYGVGYFKLVTFNDSAMTSVMRFVYALTNDEVVTKIDSKNKITAGQQLCDDLAWAREKLKNDGSEIDTKYGVNTNKLNEIWDEALEYTLNAQIEVNGELTGWAQQYDPETGKPATGRSYELPSISTGESLAVFKVLTDVVDPSERVIDAIDSFYNWSQEIGTIGYSIANVSDRTRELGNDRRYVFDNNPIKTYGRFYGLDTTGDSYEGFPQMDDFYMIFSGRDGIAKLDHNVGGHERRSSYSFTQGKTGPETKDAYELWKSNIGKLALKATIDETKSMQETNGITNATDSNTSIASDSNSTSNNKLTKDSNKGGIDHE